MLCKPDQAVSGSVRWKGIRIYAEDPDSVLAWEIPFPEYNYSGKRIYCLGDVFP